MSVSIDVEYWSPWSPDSSVLPHPHSPRQWFNFPTIVTYFSVAVLQGMVFQSSENGLSLRSSFSFGVRS